MSTTLGRHRCTDIYAQRRETLSSAREHVRLLGLCVDVRNAINLDPLNDNCISVLLQPYQQFKLDVQDSRFSEN